MIRILALLVLAASGSGAAIVTAQAQSQSIPVMVTGSTIDIAEPWRVVPSAPPDAEREIIVLAGTNNNLVIGYIATDSLSGDFTADVTGEYASLLGERSVLDKGPSYSLEVATINDVRYGIFTVAHQNRYPGLTEVHTYLSPVSTFAEGITSAYERVTVNGVRVLSRIDAPVLQTLLAQSAGIGNAEADRALPPPLGRDAVPTEVVVTPPTQTSATVEQPATPIAQNVATAVPQPVATPAVVASPAGYKFAGVVAEGHYVSPMTGAEVRWSPEWGLAPDEDFPSAGHDYDRNVDFLNLVRRDNGELRITVEFVSEPNTDVEMWLSEWTFYARAALQLILESDGVYAATVVQRGDVILMVKEATSVGDGVYSVVTLLTPIPDTADTIVLASSEITINGNPSIVMITPERVQSLVP